MSNSIGVMLVANRATSDLFTQSDSYIFGDTKILLVDNTERLKSALEESTMNVVIITEPVKWANKSSIVQQVRNQYPECYILILKPSEHHEKTDNAMKLVLIQHEPPSHWQVNSDSTNEMADFNSITILDHASGPIESDLESQFQQLFAKSGMGVFFCTSDGRILHSNQAFRQMMDVALGNYGGASDQHGFCFKSDRVKLFLQEVVQSGSVCQIDFSAQDSIEAVQSCRIHARRLTGSGDSILIGGLVENTTDIVLIKTLKEKSLQAKERLSKLSTQERRIMDQVVLGVMNKTIARRFDISEKTVERHRSNFMRKLDVSSVAELARLASIAELNNDGFP